MDYFRPGESLVSEFILWLGSCFSPTLLLFQLWVMSQNPRIGLKYMVKHMEAVCTAHMWSLLERACLREVEIFIGAHEGQQLQLERADLFGLPFMIESLVQILPACLHKFMENWELCVFLGADRAKLLQGIGAKQSSQLWPLRKRKAKTETLHFVVW